MVNLRCTQKLLKRIGPPNPAAERSTTVLGDWTANLVWVGRRRFILLVSEHSRLPVVLLGRDVKHLALNFPDTLAWVLLGLGIPALVVGREVDATREAVIDTTNNRSLLGTLNEFAFMMKYRLREDPDADLVDIALWLSDTHVGPLGYETPGEAARRLLGIK